MEPNSPGQGANATPSGGAAAGHSGAAAGSAAAANNGAATTLVVAYSANPSAAASVPLIGFRVAEQMRRLTSTVIIVHRRDAAELQQALPDVRVIGAGSARLAAALRAVTTRLFSGKWGIISMLDLPDYLLFDLHAFLIARGVLMRRRVDYALRVNPVSFRFPSLLPRLKVPVYTGPHNGGMQWPPGFRHLDAREKTGERLRWVGDTIHRLFGDSSRYAGIFAAHVQCAQTVPPRDRVRVTLMPENAVERLWPVSPHAGDARRLLFVGRLATFKAVDIAVRALARLPADVHLTIVGDGPERQPLEQLVGQLNLTERVNFVGHRPHAEVARFYAHGGVFVFPSVRESGGGVVLEAMSHGLPCLVAAWGGPMIYTQEAGVTLRVDSPHALEDDLVAAIQRFLDDPAQARRIGELSRDVVRRDYLWSDKITRMHAIAMSGVALQP